jgi:hypothetical protein
MHDHDARTPVIRVDPPLTAREVDLVSGLAGAPGAVRRILPPQPTPRSPWLVCVDGCCLRLALRVGEDPAGWLRWLVRELLDPRSQSARRRARVLALDGGHVLTGEVVLRSGPQATRVAVRANRVHEMARPGAGSPTSDRSREEVIRVDDDAPA